MMKVSTLWRSRDLEENPALLASGAKPRAGSPRIGIARLVVAAELSVSCVGMIEAGTSGSAHALALRGDG